MKKAIIGLLVLGASSILIFAGCTKNEIEAKSMEQLHRENGVPVKITTVELRPFYLEKSYNAVLTGIKESVASSMVADQVEKIHVKVGDVVQKDDIVVSFPNDNPGAQYFQSKVSFENAQTTLERMKNLYENGGISRQEYDNVETQFNVMKANWDAVRQTVKVKAPISGVVSGIYVQETDNVERGDVLLKISQTQKLKTQLWVSESDVADILKGAPALATWNSKTITGKVTQVDLALNADRQAFGVVVEFDNKESAFFSGVNAEIVIKSSISDDTVIIDRKDIIVEGEDSFVFVAQDGKAVKRDVVLGKENGIDVQIIKGLNPGDSLITEGQLLLSDGVKINII